MTTPINLLHIALAYASSNSGGKMLTSPDGKRVEIDLEAIRRVFDGEMMSAMLGRSARTEAAPAADAIPNVSPRRADAQGDEGAGRDAPADAVVARDPVLTALYEVASAAVEVVNADTYKHPMLSRADAVAAGVARLHDAVSAWRSLVSVGGQKSAGTEARR